MHYASQVRALNAAAHAALRAALDDGMSTVDELKRIASWSDAAVDLLAPVECSFHRVGAA